MSEMAEQLNWKTEHQNLKEIISTMQSKPHLSSDEQRELKELKKKRLHAKDRSHQLSS
jgi:uncharacterized protein YdcH (DUF465 family)